MIKDKKIVKQQNKKMKQKYYDFYDDIKDYSKGFKEDW